MATSVEHLDLSNVIDTVVFVGQKSAEADQLRDKVVKVIGLNNAQHDAIMLLQQVLEHSDALDETIAANEGLHGLSPLQHVQLVLRIRLWRPKPYNKVQ